MMYCAHWRAWTSSVLPIHDHQYSCTTMVYSVYSDANNATRFMGHIAYKVPGICQA